MSPKPARRFPACMAGRTGAGVNDPNGCSFIDGRYHVFFQYNPDAPVHAGIKWGHASSTDLVRWRQEPIALVNRPGELDRYGCWSGCVVDDAGVPTAVYSAVVDDIHRSDVLLARSDREMRIWRQAPHGGPGGAIRLAPRLVTTLPRSWSCGCPNAALRPFCANHSSKIDGRSGGLDGASPA